MWKCIYFFFFREIISAPQGTRKSAAREMELQAEDEQSFLSRQLNQLQAGRPDAMRVSPGVQKTPDRRVAGSPGIQANLSTLSATKKPDGYVTETFLPTF